MILDSRYEHYLHISYSSVRVNRETEPEAIDKLQRKRLELEIEIHALEREKDAASKERLQAAKKAISDVDEELQPLQAAFQAEKMRGDELNVLRRKMDELKAKIEEAERRSVRLLISLSQTLIIMHLDATLPLPPI